ncbi:MAG TPA: hypothetical protein VFZ10_20495 [Geminicoccaceae bacterium]
MGDNDDVVVTLIDRAGDDRPLLLIGGVAHLHAHRDVAPVEGGLDHPVALVLEVLKGELTKI